MRIIFGIGLCLELSSIWFTLSVIFGTEHELYTCFISAQYSINNGFFTFSFCFTYSFKSIELHEFRNAHNINVNIILT